MKVSDSVVVRGTDFGLLSALLLFGLLLVGCVNLTKPLAVQKCSSSSAGCSDDPNQVHPGDDAKKDINDDTADSSSADLAVGDDKPVVQPDAGPDLPVSNPDNPVDKGDSATVTPDTKDTTAGDVRDSLDVFDVVTPPSDWPEDKVPSPEPGPEPAGAEPSSGPEPGPEPGREPGLEPGPEPGPEPPTDGGPTDTAPSSCPIFFGSSPSTGTAGHPPNTTSTAAFCVATCDDIVGWGCSNDAGRTYSVNGAAVTCAATITKKNGYYVFRVSAGTSRDAVIYWWGTYATSCPAPAGGVFP